MVWRKRAFAVIVNNSLILIEKIISRESAKFLENSLIAALCEMPSHWNNYRE
jgi:hypothetical protein